MHPPDLWQLSLTPAWGTSPSCSCSLHLVLLGVVTGQEAAPCLREPLSLWFCSIPAVLTAGGRRFCLKPPRCCSSPPRGAGAAARWGSTFLTLSEQHPPPSCPPSPSSCLGGQSGVSPGWDPSLRSESFFWTCKTLFLECVCTHCPAGFPLRLQPAPVPPTITLLFSLVGFLLCCFLRPLTAALNPR